MTSQVSIPPAEVLLSKRVQQMVLIGEDPIGPYVYGQNNIYRSSKEDEEEESSETNFMIPPLVDLEYLFLPEKSRFKESIVQELEKLKHSVSTWGCFQAVGHGIPSSLLDDIRRVGREFFEQPMEEKNKYAKPVTEFQGYGADPVPVEGQPLDWSDRIFLNLVPEDQRDYQYWPRKPTSFKNVLEEYSEKIQNLTDIISKAMAISLHIGENSFVEQFGERAQLQGRFNYYPPCKRADRVLGLKQHADGSGFTIILEDEPGLQILKDGKWYTISEINPDAVLVLMGDHMEIMSNGIFRSPVHRVITDPIKDRVSVAMFYSPEAGKEVGPEESLINAETPRVFKSVKDYGDIHMEYYNQGMRALHVAQV